VGALVKAREMKIPICSEMLLAESIVEPTRLIRSGLEVEELERVLLLPEELRGLSLEQGVQAEEEAKK